MKKILVVIDMQNDFIDGALGTAEAVGIVDKVVKKSGTILRTVFMPPGIPMGKITWKPGRADTFP